MSEDGEALTEAELAAWRERVGGDRVRQAEFASADRSTRFRLVCVDASPSRWILRQDGALVASGVADTPESARDEGVNAAKDRLGHEFIVAAE